MSNPRFRLFLAGPFTPSLLKPDRDYFFGSKKKMVKFARRAKRKGYRSGFSDLKTGIFLTDLFK